MMKQGIMRAVLVLGVTVTVFLNSGCQDKKKASVSTFKAALEEHFASQPVCLDIGVKFPDVVQLDAAGKPIFTINSKLEEALVSVNLLTSKQGTVSIPDPFSGKPQEKQAITYSIATPSEWTERRVRYGTATVPAPCYAKVQIVSVDKFSEPGDFMGQHISKVDFTYRLTDVQPWIHAPALKKALPNADQLASTDARTGSAILVLTNNGWEVDPNYRL